MRLSTSSPYLQIVDGDSLKASSQLEVPMTAVVTAVGFNAGEDYTLRKEVFLYPTAVKSMRTSIAEQLEESQLASPLNFRITATTVDGDTVADPQEAEVKLLYEDDSWISVDNQRKKITFDRDAAKKDFTLFLFWKGRLVSLEKHHVKFAEYSWLEAEISFKSAQSNQQIYSSSPSDIYSGGVYSIAVKRKESIRRSRADSS